MIKVHLLGVERSTKRTRRRAIKINVPSGLIGITALVLLLVGGMVAVWLIMVGRVALLERQKTERQQELAVLKETVKEVENFEANKKSFEEKIAIIEQLRKKQSGPVRLLDDLSRSLPGRVWLTVVAEKSGTIDLEGRAVTNAEIVDFINSLKASPRISEVVLVESRQVKEEGIPVYNFKLRFNLVA